jgi:hypothetical protein
MELQEKGFYTAFFYYSGHVNHIHVQIYKGKWKARKKPVCEEYICLLSQMPLLEELLAYIKSLRNK